MRAVASVLAAWALGTILSGQAFAQSYGPESDDDADAPATYSDQAAPAPDYRSGYRDDADDQSLRRGPVRRYYRDEQSGEWRPLARGYGTSEPTYRDEPSYRDEPTDRYRRGGARVGEWRQVPPRRSSSSYDRPSYRTGSEERIQREDRIGESRPASRRYAEPIERNRYDEPRERDRAPVSSSERPRQWWTPDHGRRATWDDPAFKVVPRGTQSRVTASGVRPASENTVTIPATEYRELQKQARELRQLRDRREFPDAPARRTEPEARED